MRRKNDSSLWLGQVDISTSAGAESHHIAYKGGESQQISTEEQAAQRTPIDSKEIRLTAWACLLPCELVRDQPTFGMAIHFIGVGETSPLNKIMRR